MNMRKLSINKACILLGTLLLLAVGAVNRPLSSRQVKKEKLRHEGLVPVSKGSQTL